MTDVERVERVAGRAAARLFATRDGEVVLEFLREKLGWNEPSSAGNGACVDVNLTLIRDGQKVALKFLSDLIALGQQQEKTSDE